MWNEPQNPKAQKMGGKKIISPGISVVCLENI